MQIFITPVVQLRKKGWKIKQRRLIKTAKKKKKENRGNTNLKKKRMNRCCPDDSCYGASKQEVTMPPHAERRRLIGAPPSPILNSTPVREGSDGQRRSPAGHMIEEPQRESSVLCALAPFVSTVVHRDYTHAYLHEQSLVFVCQKNTTFIYTTIK